MDEQNSASSTNTVLIVIVLLILVGFGVWWFATRAAPSEPQKQETNEPVRDVNIDVTLPGPEENDENSEPVPQ